MIDTHAHINSRDISYFKKEISCINNLDYLDKIFNIDFDEETSEEVIAFKKEISRINNLDYLDKIINVGLDEETNKEVLVISGNCDKFYCALGIHPLREGRVESILELCEFSPNRSRVVAIGETGIDSTGDFIPQAKKFIETIEIANFLKLPIIIHANNTNEKILDILKRHPAHHGFVFHCFQPNMFALEEIIRRDGYISVGKPITRPNAKKSLEAVRNIPLDNLLIELDYPYMSNDPTNDGRAVFKKIQELRKMEYEELERALDRNAKRLFKGLRD
ncbi:MAG: TatD family hydrolase [Bacilli bacterium]|nr:TatD family hydrolase [Bacilli bacterium]